MESLFPWLFDFWYVAMILPRLAVALAFGLIAQHLYRVRGEFSVTSFFLIGKPGMVGVYLKIAVTAGIAFLLAIGLFTQGAALIGLIASIKYWALAKKHASLFPHGELAYFLLAVMCITLLIGGPGAFAVDLPY